jgi:hypothetical protein
VVRVNGCEQLKDGGRGQRAGGRNNCCRAAHFLDMSDMMKGGEDAGALGGCMRGGLEEGLRQAGASGLAGGQALLCLQKGGVGGG